MSVLQRSALDADGARVDVFTSDDYAEGGGATLQDIVDEAVDIEGAIGDETTASQSADSSVSATLIERVTALVDALTSGQADDEIRVALASDLLSGNLDVNVNGQTGEVSVNLSSDSLSGNLDVDLASASAEPLDVSGETVPTEPQTPVQLENSSGKSVDPAAESTLSEIKEAAEALDNALASAGTDTLDVSTPEALDVSAATVTVDQSSTVAIQEDTALDVSAAEVDVNLTSDGAGLLSQSRFNDVVNNSDELKIDGSLSVGNLSVDNVGLEANDGNGTVAGIYRTNNALHTQLAGQATNISVDLENDNVGIASESTLSSLTDALQSNGSDTVQVALQNETGLAQESTLNTLLTESTFNSVVNASGEVKTDTSLIGALEIEADDGGGNISRIQRSGTSLQTAVEQWNAGVLSIQEDTALDVSGAVVSVQEDTALDVSAAEVDVNLSSQGLSQLASTLELTDGTSYGEVQRTGTALNIYLSGQASNLSVDLESDNAGILSEARFDDIVNGSNELKTDTSVSVDTVEIEASDGAGTVSSIERTGKALDTYLTGQDANISIDLETDNVGLASETTLSNIAGALASKGADTLEVTLQNETGLATESTLSSIDSGVSLEANDGGGTFGEIYRSGNSLQAAIEQWNAGTLSVQENSALDVSAATVSVQEETALDVSAATVSIQEKTPLDVSGAEVDVNISSQGLSQLGSVIEATNGTSYGEVQRTGDALNAHLTSQASNISVDLADNSLAENLDVDVSTVSAEPIDVSAATVDTQQRGTLADGSGAISSAAPQDVFAANGNRKYLLVQNLSDSLLFVNIGADANKGAGSIPLNPNGGSGAGGSLTFENEGVPTGKVSIIGPSGATFTAKEI